MEPLFTLNPFTIPPSTIRTSIALSISITRLNSKGDSGSPCPQPSQATTKTHKEPLTSTNRHTVDTQKVSISSTPPQGHNNLTYTISNHNLHDHNPSQYPIWQPLQVSSLSVYCQDECNRSYHDGWWIYSLIGKEDLGGIIMQAYGMSFLYASCSVFEENASM